MLIQDKMNENIEILERYHTILSKDNSIHSLVRKFFKSMHEILYEIESSKKLELDYVIASVFGPSFDVKETKQVVEKLKGIYKQIDQLIKEDDYAAVVRLRDENKDLMQKAERYLEGVRQHKENSGYSIEQAFDNVLNFNVGDIDAEFSKIVNDYIKLEKLSMKDKGGKGREDKVHQTFGVEQTFMHKKEVTCILNLKNGMIVTGSIDTNIRIWDPKTGKCVRVLDGHTHAVLCVIELESGFLASGSLDQTTIVWNPNKGQIVEWLQNIYFYQSLRTCPKGSKIQL